MSDAKSVNGDDGGSYDGDIAIGDVTTTVVLPSPAPESPTVELQPRELAPGEMLVDAAVGGEPIAGAHDDSVAPADTEPPSLPPVAATRPSWIPPEVRMPWLKGENHAAELEEFHEGVAAELEASAKEPEESAADLDEALDELSEDIRLPGSSRPWLCPSYVESPPPARHWRATRPVLCTDAETGKRRRREEGSLLDDLPEAVLDDLAERGLAKLE